MIRVVCARVVDRILRGKRVLTDGAFHPRSVHIANGRIVGVHPYEAVPLGAPVIEIADEHVLLPALVDTHVHINDPGRADWEGFSTATQAALRGGVTTLVDMPLN